MAIQSVSIQLFLSKKEPDSNDYLQLQCERDLYSKKKIVELKKMVAQEIYDRVRSFFMRDKDQASVLRWLLRGLLVEQAIRKVQIDLLHESKHFRKKI